ADEQQEANEDVHRLLVTLCLTLHLPDDAWFWRARTAADARVVAVSTRLNDGSFAQFEPSPNDRGIRVARAGWLGIGHREPLALVKRPGPGVAGEVLHEDALRTGGERSYGL